MYNKAIIFGILLNVAFCLQAVGEPIAGEKLKRQETTPYFDLEPKRNLTEVMPSVDQADDPDIYFEADEIISNEKNKTLEAIGNVIIRRANLTLYTDKLIYEQLTDNIEAIGNVRLEEQSGHVVYADRVNLADKMSRAEMNKIKVILSDETKIWAEQFRKKENDNKVM